MHIEIEGSIGNRIRFNRMVKNMSATKLASIIGVAQPTISSWEKGQKNPTIGNLVALERALGIGVLSKDYLEDMERQKSETPECYNTRGRA